MNDLFIPPPTPQRSQLVFFPMAPSTNALWRMTKGGMRIKTETYNDWLSHAGWVIRSQRDLWTKVEGPVLLQLLFERASLLSDVDNRLKATIDALVKGGVMGDDRQVLAICVSWCPMGTITETVEESKIAPQATKDGLRASKDGAGMVRIWPVLPDGVNKFTLEIASDAKGGIWHSTDEDPP